MINIFNAKTHKKTINKAVSFALKRLEIDESAVDIEIALISEEEIRELNASHRNIDKVTDVLSFPSVEVKLPFNPDDYPYDINPENDAVILGEIYICLERAKEQAEEYGHSLTREIAFLTAHGVLHLLGFDHPEGDNEMETLQEEILDAAGFVRELPADGQAESEGSSGGENGERNDAEDEIIMTGTVAIIGRPNAGKSTLINTLTGEKVSIVSWKPQTTRNRILGIMNTPDAQVLFLDTPGLHAPRNALGKFMMRSVTAALDGVDIVLYVIDGEKGVDERDGENIERYVATGKQVIVAVNKIDHITREKVGEILTQIAPIKGLAAVVPVSALKNKNVEPLKNEIFKLLKDGRREYPEDIYTDKNMMFMASEIIREKALRLLNEEIPFGIGVMVNKYEVRPSGTIEIDADVICQKAAHKPIILGKGGGMIKTISTYARQDLETMTGSKVFLTLWVRVREDWRDDTSMLQELGYGKDNY